MCVPENASLRWISSVVAQLAAPELRTIQLALAVNNVVDLRHFNSECANPELAPAVFDDMRALDWTDLERSFQSDRLPGLQRVVLYGQGSPEGLKAHIKVTCPQLHARGLLSLVLIPPTAPRWARPATRSKFPPDFRFSGV